MLTGKKILLIISGGIAAYKSLELIRLLKKQNAHVKCVLTNGGSQFITPLSVAALTEEEVYTDLWSLKDETEMGHIRLSREADLILIAPASANLMAQMTHGLAEDLASTTLLASNRPIMICPAMNPMMWQHKATQDNLKELKHRDITVVGPDDGDMACGETGSGRMSEPESILDAVVTHFQKDKPLAGKRALVTSGPTHEPIDPVRFIGNRSSGKQGHAIAKSLANAGASVTLVSGPVSIPDPKGVKTVRVKTAKEMLDASLEALEDKTDIAICAAAVADWKPASIATHKMKKTDKQDTLEISLEKTQDILQTIGTDKKRRPKLVIGFAAETENLIDNAIAKLEKKGCDWILANNVGEKAIFGGDNNHVHLITKDDSEEWGEMPKDEIARDLVTRIGGYLKAN